MELNIIDFEASALRGGYPIQVAVILANGDTYDSYIYPDDEWIDTMNWDPESEQIHKIPMSLLREHGKDIVTVANELNQFIDGREVFCDGGLYDLQWCACLFAFANVTKTFMLGDIVRDLLKGDIHNIPLYIAKREATKQLQLREHDALNDVKIIQRAIELYSCPHFVSDNRIRCFS